MILLIIDSPKGKFFYFHVLPIIRNMGVDMKTEIVTLDGLREKRRNGSEVICGDSSHKKLFKNNFLLIDKFIDETAPYSFSKQDIKILLEELKCFQK